MKVVSWTNERVLLIGAIVALVLLVGAFVFKGDRSTDDPASPSGTENSISILGNPDKPTPEPRPAQPEQGSALPDAPKDGIAVLVAAYSGDDLVQQLNEAGIHYAKVGIEEAKEFMLNLPPGKIGGYAVMTTISAFKSEADNAELLTFLKTEGANLPAGWVHAGLQAIRGNLAYRNPVGAVEQFAGSSLLTLDEKAKYVSSILYTAPADTLSAELIPLVESLEDQELARRLRTTEPYLLSRLGDDPEDACADISEMSQQEREASIQNFEAAIRRLPDPLQAIDALAHSSIPEKYEILETSCGEWIANDTNAALTWVATLEDPEMVDTIVSNSWRSIAKFDVDAAGAWIAKIKDRQLRAETEKRFDAAFTKTGD